MDKAVGFFYKEIVYDVLNISELTFNERERILEAVDMRKLNPQRFTYSFKSKKDYKELTKLFVHIQQSGPL